METFFKNISCGSLPRTKGTSGATSDAEVLPVASTRNAVNSLDSLTQQHKLNPEIQPLKFPTASHQSENMLNVGMSHTPIYPYRLDRQFLKLVRRDTA